MIVTSSILCLVEHYFEDVYILGERAASSLLTPHDDEAASLLGGAFITSRREDGGTRGWLRARAR
jgi:hypothetical protein